MITDDLRKAIKESLKTLALEANDIMLEHPADPTHGDYSTNVALVHAKSAGMRPREFAEKITKLIYDYRLQIQELEKVEVAGAGFINFFLKKEFFVESVKKIDQNFGKSATGKGRKALIEYSSPNIAKPFTVGHLRSTIIGDSIANILEFTGYAVIRDNHLGDWGTQFGKQIVAIKKWSSLEEIKKSENGMKLLVDLYVKFHTESEKDPSLEDEARSWFVKLEKGDAEAREIYDVTIDISMKYFRMVYERLKVHPFDTYNGEAFYEKLLPEILSDIEKAGIAKESEGAKLIFFKDDKFPPLMIQKKDGATLYATRDLATDKWRIREYGGDVLIVNETGVEQSLYFSQLFEAEEMLGYAKKENRVHVGHGFVRSRDGRMSTRKGNVIWLEEVLDEAVKRAKEIKADTAEAVGIGAIKFNDLKREAKQDIVFDWDEVLNLKGDSGPYLQYSYARAQSVLRKAKENKLKDDLKAELPSEVGLLEKLLVRFPEVVERAGVEYAPHYIATYAIELASEFNNYYAHNKILDAGEDVPYRLMLTRAFSVVIKNALCLLGIEATEVM